MFDVSKLPMLLLWTPGIGELAIILVIVIIIFGAGRLSGIGKGLGEGIRNFKKGIKGEDDEKPQSPEKH